MPHEFKDDRLDDIKERDILNLEIFLNKKGRVTKKFNSSVEAHAFQGARLVHILRKLGVDIPRQQVDPHYNSQEIMDKNNIVVESRAYVDEPEDEWRSGMYVYKDNEIAGFVGFPQFNELVFMGYNVLCTEKI
ncbi:MAG: hypothetical protein ACYSWP_15910 [Planctomycetota bacterium]|jgi:hypothetical protein